MGYTKDRVCINEPRNIPELKAEVCRVIKAISPEMCRSVINNFAVRVRECLARKGAHIEHVLQQLSSVIHVIKLAHFFSIKNFQLLKYVDN